MAAADLYLPTDELDQAQVLDRVMDFLKTHRGE
jgi:hypothetical protein